MFVTPFSLNWSRLVPMRSFNESVFVYKKSYMIKDVLVMLIFTFASTSLFDICGKRKIHSHYYYIWL